MTTSTSTKVPFRTLQMRLSDHKRAGLIAYGLSVRDAQKAGLMDAQGEFIEARAKVTRPKATKKRVAKRTVKAPVRKVTETRWDGTSAGRKAWNDAFVALARTSGLRDARGVTLYRITQTRWAEVSRLREAGLTPQRAVAEMLVGKTWVRKGQSCVHCGESGTKYATKTCTHLVRA